MAALHCQNGEKEAVCAAQSGPNKKTAQQQSCPTKHKEKEARKMLREKKPIKIIQETQSINRSF